MSPRSLAVAIVAFAWSASASAVTCYQVFDRNDNVVYRSTVPPVDLSDKGAAAREAMRQRGEYLMFGDFDKCPGVAFFTGSGGSSGLSLDDVVMGMPAMPMNGGVSPAKGPNPNAAVQPAGRGTSAGSARRR
jgi:hypothetical protein